jgi:uncharacterized protein
MQTKKTLVIGASENPARYSNLAIKKLLTHQQPVVALGNKPGSVGTVTIETDKKPFENIDTITHASKNIMTIFFLYIHAV